MNRLNTKTFRIPKTLEIEVQYTLYSKAYQLLVYTIYGNSSVLYFNFNKAARIPAKCEVGHGGGGEPGRKGCGKRDSQGSGKREKKGKNQAKLRRELGLKGTGGGKFIPPRPPPPPKTRRASLSI